MSDDLVKVVPPGSYPFGESAAQLVKVAHNGKLRGNDLKDFIKRAGYRFADQVKNIAMGPGDYLAHVLAIGSTDYFGPNRNFDGFKEADCRECHPTFVKFARCYRNHLNKNPERSYGLIKASSYSEDMHRIELLALYNGTKEAAARNGGLVADEELDELHSGRDFPGSMACRLPFDVCSGCGNRAKNRTEYCRGVDEGGQCKQGGLRNNIGCLTGDDHNPILHADNPGACFFDYSKVARGADRTSFVLSGHVKAANAAIVGGAALAEYWGVTAPSHLSGSEEAADMYKLACRLAAIEDNMPRADRWALAFQSRPETTWHDHGGLMGEALAALAMAKVAMPVEGFVAMVNQNVDGAAISDQVRDHLPGIYNRLVKSGEIHSLIESNPFVPASKTPPLAVRRWALAKSAEYSIDPATAEKRLARNALYCERLPAIKQASSSSSGPAAELAKHYASYQLAMLASLKDSPDYDLTARLCIVQNHM